MGLVLITASYEYKQQIVDMLEEWKNYNTVISPSLIVKVSHADFNNYLHILNNHKSCYVKFAYDTKHDKMIGAVAIRYYLDEQQFNYGGHIEDGVIPSEKRKGEVLKLALLECKKRGMYKVLVTCSKDNKTYKKSILNRGGVFKDEVDTPDRGIIERYWITLSITHHL